MKTEKMLREELKEKWKPIFDFVAESAFDRVFGEYMYDHTSTFSSYDETCYLEDTSVVITADYDDELEQKGVDITYELATNEGKKEGLEWDCRLPRIFEQGIRDDLHNRWGNCEHQYPPEQD